MVRANDDLSDKKTAFDNLRKTKVQISIRTIWYAVILIGLINKIFHRKIVNIFLPIYFLYVLGAQRTD